MASAPRSEEGLTRTHLLQNPVVFFFFFFPVINSHYKQNTWCRFQASPLTIIDPLTSITLTHKKKILVYISKKC